MKPVGETAAMPGQIVKFFGLDFNICGPISENEARQILIDASNELYHFFRIWTINYLSLVEKID